MGQPYEITVVAGFGFWNCFFLGIPPRKKTIIQRRYADSADQAVKDLENELFDKKFGEDGSGEQFLGLYEDQTKVRLVSGF